MAGCPCVSSDLGVSVPEEPEANILVNGHLSGAFPVASAVKQGCRMSSVLFVLCISRFVCAMRVDLEPMGST